MSLQFDLPKEQSSIIKVIGVGGGGSNAVNHMFEKGIRGVNYVVCNTDQQALDISPVYNKIQLGPEITQGLGAGSRPEVGEQATIESEQEVRDLLSKNTKMVFVTAGMGGGTGTGGAPVVAKIAREMGILTVGIVTTPFSFEGRRKLNQAEEGIRKLREAVDSIIIISNDKIRDIYGNLSQREAFSKADDILTTAAKGISEIITVAGMINVDFADVEYVMKNSGLAVMGTATAEGKDRALRAVHDAINSPLLNDNNITGARNILINITSGNLDVTLDETTAINEYVQEAAGNDTDIIFGSCRDESLGDKLSVTIIATGFEPKTPAPVQKVTKEVIDLSVVQQTPAAPAPAPASSNDFQVRRETPATENLNIDTPADNKSNENPFLDLFSTDVHKGSSSDNNSNRVEFFFDMTNDDTESSSSAEEELTEDESLNFTVRLEDEPTINNEDKYSFYTSQTRKDDFVPQQPVAKTENVENDRVRKLKDVSFKWDNLNKIQEYENMPAYMRRGVILDDVPTSDSDNTSKYTLNSFDVNGVVRPEIRKNNSYLNNNVD
jgi:cell division protein FtsZ